MVPTQLPFIPSILAIMDKGKINKELLEQLNELMEHSPPKELKESLESIFRAYVGSLSDESIPNRLKETITDYYNLIYFIERLESVAGDGNN